MNKIAQSLAVAISLSAALIASASAEKKPRYSNCNSIMPVLAKNADVVADLADKAANLATRSISGANPSTAADTAQNAATVARGAHEAAEKTDIQTCAHRPNYQDD